MTSPLQEIARQLGRMHSSGAFATRKTCGPKDLHLSVEGIGRVSLPVAPARYQISTPGTPFLRETA